MTTLTKSTSRQKSSARLHAVQAVYQMIMTGNRANDVVDDFNIFHIGSQPDLEDLARPAAALFSAIVQGVERQRNELETVIANHLKNEMTATQMADKEPLLFSILLCGAYELMAHTDIDAPVIISDYINVAHSYYQGKESSIINGILDSMRLLYRVV